MEKEDYFEYVSLKEVFEIIDWMLEVYDKYESQQNAVTALELLKYVLKGKFKKVI